MMTERLRVDPVSPDPETIARAAECLRRGGLVAFPTETVYGLGVHALDRDAVRRLFTAKERPANDPLIVHVVDLDAAAPLVALIPPAARMLASRFWPGPLTLVLPRSGAVPDEVTAGLDTVAIRVPAHPVARALLRAAGIPVAAPSANLFSRPSPTTAAHVLADLDGRIDMVLDAGAAPVGVESTVVDLSPSPPVVLRPGAIGVELLSTVITGITVRPSSVTSTSPQRSPGLLSMHYAPRARVTLYEGTAAGAVSAMADTARRLINEGKSVAILTYGEDQADLGEPSVRFVSLGTEADPAGIAARLYAALRACDDIHADVVLVRAPTTPHELSVAVRDRLRRAAAEIVTVPSERIW